MSRIAYRRHQGALCPELPSTGAATLHAVTKRRFLLFSPDGRGVTLDLMNALTVGATQAMGWDDALISFGPTYCYGGVMALVPDQEESDRWCEELREHFAQRHPNDPVLAWKRGPDVGLSAMTLCLACEGVEVSDPSLPADLADLARCFTMLSATGLDLEHALAAPPRGWAPLFDAWDELGALMAAEDFQRARDVLKAALEVER